MKIGQLTRQVSVLVGRRQLSLKVPINSQKSFQPQISVGTTLHLLEPDYLQFNFIPKSHKSTQAKNEKLAVKRIPRRFTQEEDQKLVEHVNKHGKSKSSLKDIGKTLDRSYNSVISRCRKLLSDNEFETNSGQKQWDYAEDKKLVDFVFKVRKIKPSTVSCLNDIKESEFKEIAPDLQRSTHALYDHWKNTILPYLEPQLEELATSKQLKKDVLKVII